MDDNRTAHTISEVLAAAEQGITKTGAAKLLHCSRQTIQNYCKRWKTVANAFEDKKRELVDLAHMGLRGAVLNREPWAVAFTLKTLGKDEGYAERQEVTGKDGGPLTLQVVETIVTSRRENRDTDLPDAS